MKALDTKTGRRPGDGGLVMAIASNSTAMRTTAALLGTVLLALLAAPAAAHHSYAMYDGKIYRVFTGVIVRVVPNAAHFEMHFVPLSEGRDALVRDEKGEPL